MNIELAAPGACIGGALPADEYATRKCRVEGCGEPITSRGWRGYCPYHGQNVRRHGFPESRLEKHHRDFFDAVYAYADEPCEDTLRRLAIMAALYGAERVGTRGRGEEYRARRDGAPTTVLWLLDSPAVRAVEEAALAFAECPSEPRFDARAAFMQSNLESEARALFLKLPASPQPVTGVLQ